MMRNLYILGFLGLVLLTSGCFDNTSTQSDGGEAIDIIEMSVTPDTIYADSSTTAILHIRNSGQLDANLTIDSGWRQTEQEVEEQCSESIPPGIPSDITDGDECVEEVVGETELHGNYGDRLLTNRCRDIFEISDFSARGPGDTESDYYNLPTGTEARFTWSLSSEDANVPLQGLSCNLRFEVPFDYNVNAYRQLQFLEDDSVEGVTNLDSRSSRGPMAIEIDTIGSTSSQGPSTFVEGDSPEVIVRLRNQAEEGTQFTGIIEADVPEINPVGFEFEDECQGALGEEKITMYEGESQPIRCEISDEVYEELEGSARGEVTVNAEYTYVKDLGSREVNVQYRGN